ncbi:LysR substrate-binding domain-containing protein [Edaphovirga cremea]|uniref:LysR substrate-binding domain-containing protein n=1 Tax=Edaphovirga cremea TaxID=2267246 RepID=UPI0039897518
MDIHHFKTFNQVVISGSFTKAAQALFLSQPAISMQIQALESFLKVNLFDRSRRQVSLTKEGEVLFEYTQRIFQLFEEVQSVFQDISKLQVGRLRIGATGVMGTYYLTRFIHRFHERFPGIELEILAGNSWRIAELVSSGEVELGFAGRSVIRSQVQQMLLHRENYKIVVGKSSPLACRAAEILPPEVLLEMPFVMREKGTRMRAKMSSWFKRHTSTLAPENTVTISNIEATKRLISSGYGVTAIPHLAVFDELEQGEMVELTVKGFNLAVDYYLVCHSERKLSHAALGFISLMHEDAPNINWGDIPELLDNIFGHSR